MQLQPTYRRSINDGSANESVPLTLMGTSGDHGDSSTQSNADSTTMEDIPNNATQASDLRPMTSPTVDGQVDGVCQVNTELNDVWAMAPPRRDNPDLGVAFGGSVIHSPNAIPGKDDCVQREQFDVINDHSCHRVIELVGYCMSSDDKRDIHMTSNVGGENNGQLPDSDTLYNSITKVLPKSICEFDFDSLNISDDGEINVDKFINHGTDHNNDGVTIETDNTIRADSSHVNGELPINICETIPDDIVHPSGHTADNTRNLNMENSGCQGASPTHIIPDSHTKDTIPNNSTHASDRGNITSPLFDDRSDVVCPVNTVLNQTRSVEIPLHDDPDVGVTSGSVIQLPNAVPGKDVRALLTVTNSDSDNSVCVIDDETDHSSSTNLLSDENDVESNKYGYIGHDCLPILCRTILPPEYQAGEGHCNHQTLAPHAEYVPHGSMMVGI